MNTNNNHTKKPLMGNRERDLIEGLKSLHDQLTDLLIPGTIYADPIGVVQGLTTLKNVYPPYSFMNKLAGMVADETLEIVKEKNLIFSIEMNHAIAEAEKAEQLSNGKINPETNDDC